jgi:hypothetical protein
MTRNTDDTTEGPTEDVDTPEGVLSPEDLELPDDVAELEEGRYVVPTDENEGSAPSPTASRADADADANADDQTEREPVEALSGAYAVAVTMRTPEGTDAIQLATDDVRDLFDELLVWYAERLAPGTDPEEALSVLLSESSLSVVPFDD